MIKVILYVEDEEDDVLLFQHAMKKAGHAGPIHIATDGQNAIDYLKGEGQFGDRAEFPLPHLVLLDLKLPQVPGLEVLRWIRQQAGLSVPVVIMSSSENDNDIAAAYGSGANAYLVKPFDSSQFPEIIKIVKDFWLKHNRLAPDIGRDQRTRVSLSG